MPEMPVVHAMQGPVARVTLNRPQSRNALNLPMCEALRDVFAAAAGMAEARVVLLDAAGPVFCAGADLKERDGKDAAWIKARRQAAFAAYAAIEKCAKPVIALVDGAVVGSGGEIAMSCDFIIASTAATFRFPEPGWGTVGATQRLQRVIGKRRAKELLFTGRAMPAEEAYGLGLVARLVGEGEVEAAGRAVAEQIAKAPPLAMMLTKQAVDMGEEVSLAEGLAIEMQKIEACLAGAEWREGLAAFARDVGKPDGKG